LVTAMLPVSETVFMVLVGWEEGRGRVERGGERRGRVERGGEGENHNHPR